MRTKCWVLGLIGLGTVACGESNETPPETKISSGGMGHAGSFSASGASSAAGGDAGSAGSAGAGSVGSAGTFGAGSGGSAGSAGSGGTPAPLGGSSGSAPSGDPGSGSCMDFTPCGGDPTGTWTFSTCIDPAPQGLSLFCSDVEETITYDGEITFTANGEVTSTLVVRTDAVVSASCVDDLGGCAQSPGFLGSCVPGESGSCICHTESTNQNQGTWSSEGNVLSTTYGENTSSAYYCRDGDQILMRASSDDGHIYVYTMTLK